MKAWSAYDITATTKGQLCGENFQAFNVCTDTRVLQSGDLFVALDGANFKGSQFIEQAKEKGAVAAVVNEYQAVDLPQIVVENTLIALGQLAKARRLASKATFIALTGTNGKTSTKEMLKVILQQRGATLATKGNLNNDIGVPLTLFELTDAHQYAVIEMGANHSGEIAYLADIAKPDIVGITNVSAAHLQGFGSYEGVVKAKTEIYTHSYGPMVVNKDMPCANEWLNLFPARPTTTFSLNKPADVMVTEISDDARTFTLVIGSERHTVHWQLDGKHNIANALAACALAKCAGIDARTIANALDGLVLKQARLSAYQIGLHCIYDDTYNANPASFRAGIDVIKHQPYSVVVAGDMGELGENSALLHQQTAQYANDNGIDEFWCVGQFADNYAKGFPQARLFNDMSVMAASLNTLLQKNSPVTILVKGSRSAKMERLFTLCGIEEKIKETS